MNAILQNENENKMNEKKEVFEKIGMMEIIMEKMTKRFTKIENEDRWEKRKDFFSVFEEITET